MLNTVGSPIHRSALCFLPQDSELAGGFLILSVCHNVCKLTPHLKEKRGGIVWYPSCFASDSQREQGYSLRPPIHPGTAPYRECGHPARMPPHARQSLPQNNYGLVVYESYMLAQILLLICAVAARACTRSGDSFQCIPNSSDYFVYVLLTMNSTTGEE